MATHSRLSVFSEFIRVPNVFIRVPNVFIRVPNVFRMSQYIPSLYSQDTRAETFGEFAPAVLVVGTCAASCAMLLHV